MMWLILYFLHIFIIWSNSLKIFENALSSSDYKLFYHRTADFGPQLNTYNISGALQIMHPLTGCNIDKYLNKNASDYMVGGEARKYDQIYAAEIVLILRGNCTFSNKVYNAQLLGAIGVIIGDYNSSVGEEWIVMSKDDDGNDILIPAVFVPHNTYQWILKLLLSYNTDNNVNVNNDNILVTDGGVYAMLDSDGEYIAPTSTFWLAAFGIVIIVIPTLWCFIVCMALLRKKIINYVQRSRRRQYLTQIPIILYKGNGTAESEVAVDAGSVAPIGSIGLSVINKKNKGDGDEYITTSYAKLVNMDNSDNNNNVILEETENDNNSDNGTEEVVQDGPDDVISDTSSFSTNIKRVSGFLFSQFGRKKESVSPHNDSCAICLDDFQLNEELRLLPCYHGFHTRCIDPWLSKSSELCPMCKQSIFMGQQNGDNSSYSILKICCISNQNQNQSQQQNGGNRRRRRRRPRINNNGNNDGNENIMDDDNNDDQDGILVMSDSNHSQSDDNNNNDNNNDDNDNN